MSALTGERYAAGGALPGPMPSLAELARRPTRWRPRSSRRWRRRSRAFARSPAILRRVHRRLWFLFDRGAKVPPYEGAWEDAPQLAGKAALLADVAGFYAAFGLVPGEAQPDVEDHIAAECEFMSALALKEAYALAQRDDEGVAITSAAQSRFVGDHLGRWSGTFAEALRDASPLPYYGALATPGGG